MINKFELLGVEPQFSLDPAELERRYKELSKRFHPDRFATAPAKDRLASMQASQGLNDAYRTLRAPAARAAHLLELHGRKLGENDSVDQTFLLEILELREALDDARRAKDEARLVELEDDIRGRHRTAMAALAVALDEKRWDDAKAELLLLRYFDRFLAAHEAGDDDGAIPD